MSFWASCSESCETLREILATSTSCLIWEQPDASHIGRRASRPREWSDVRVTAIGMTQVSFVFLFGFTSAQFPIAIVTTGLLSGVQSVIQITDARPDFTV